MTEQDAPEMVERVALAIKRFETRPGAELSEDGPWRRFELAKARAAIEALREPTEAMLKAGENTEYGDSYHYAAPRHVWPAMISAALSTQNTEET